MTTSRQTFSEGDLIEHSLDALKEWLGISLVTSIDRDTNNITLLHLSLDEPETETLGLDTVEQNWEVIQHVPR